LFQYIERRQGLNEIKAMGYDAVLANRVLKMVNVNEYKQTSLSHHTHFTQGIWCGRRALIVGKYLS
jgi:NAD+ synthase (glutamine-hydrolysing)